MVSQVESRGIVHKALSVVLNPQHADQEHSTVDKSMQDPDFQASRVMLGLWQRTWLGHREGLFQEESSGEKSPEHEHEGPGDG